MKLSLARWCMPIAGMVIAATASSANAQTHLKPGLWQMTIQSKHDGVTPQMPKLTPQQQAQMEKMGIKPPSAGNAGITVQTCLTKEQVEHDEPPKPRDDAQQKCAQTDMKHSGNTVSWKMVCTGAHPMSGSGSMTMDSPETYSSSVNMVSQDATHGPMAFSSQVQGKWLGSECPKKQ